MKQGTRAFYLGVFVLFCALSSTNANMLFSYTTEFSGGFGGIGTFPPPTLTCAISTDENYWWLYDVPLFAVNWSTNAVGTTLTATAANNGNFNSFAAAMTDGNTNHIWNLVSSRSGGIIFPQLEPSVYFNNNPGSPADLKGYQIDSVSLKLNSMQLYTTIVPAPGVYFDYNVTLSAVGHAIPEPATWSLLAVGMGVLLIRRLRSCRS